MSYTEKDRAYARTPKRSAYVRNYYKTHYKQVKFYVVTQVYNAINADGEYHTLTPNDQLFRREFKSHYFTCPARNLTNLLIPKPLLKRKAFVVKK